MPRPEARRGRSIQAAPAGDMRPNDCYQQLYKTGMVHVLRDPMRRSRCRGATGDDGLCARTEQAGIETRSTATGVVCSAYCFVYR